MKLTPITNPFDSGWRDISGYLSSGWAVSTAAGYARILRRNKTIRFEARLAPTAILAGVSRNIASNLMDSYPTGFRPSNDYVLLGQAATFANGTTVLLRDNRNVLELRYGAGTWSEADLVMVTGQWETSTPLPTAWPGLPA